VSLEHIDDKWATDQWDNHPVRQLMRILMVEDQHCFIEVTPDVFEYNPAAQAAIDAAIAAGRKPRYGFRNISEGGDIAQVP
jgi:hypothetical protein